MRLNRPVGLLPFVCSLAALAQSVPAPALRGLATFRPSPRVAPPLPPVAVAPVVPSPRPADRLAERRFVLQQQELQALRLAAARERAEREAADEAARQRDLRRAEVARVDPASSEPVAAPCVEPPSYAPAPRDAGSPAPDSPIYHWVDAEGVEHFSDEPGPR